jgi:hypothetical protein
MRTRTRVLSLALIVTFALSGCAHAAPSSEPATPSPAVMPTPSSTPTGSPALADPEILPSGLGSLHIGESIAASDMVALDPAYCAPTPPAPITAEMGRWRSTGLGFVPIAFGPTPILTSLVIYDPALKTAHGIHVGSTLEDLRAGYPELVRIQGTYSTVYFINGDGGRLTFEVYENADAIKGLPQYVFNTVGSITISPVNKTEFHGYAMMDAPGGCT